MKVCLIKTLRLQRIIKLLSKINNSITKIIFFQLYSLKTHLREGFFNNFHQDQVFLWSSATQSKYMCHLEYLK